MAATKVVAKNGNLTVAGIGGDFGTFDIESRQQVDNTTGYSEGSDADHSGSGVREWTLDFSLFTMKGAASTSPGLDTLSEASAAVVATVDTSCTYSGNFVIENEKLSHRKIAGAIVTIGRGFNKGTVTGAWVTS